MYSWLSFEGRIHHVTRDPSLRFQPIPRPQAGVALSPSPHGRRFGVSGSPPGGVCGNAVAGVGGHSSLLSDIPVFTCYVCVRRYVGAQSTSRAVTPRCLCGIVLDPPRPHAAAPAPRMSPGLCRWRVFLLVPSQGFFSPC